MNIIRSLLIVFVAMSVTACMAPDPSQVASTYMVPQPSQTKSEAKWYEPGDVIAKQEVLPEKVAHIPAAALVETANPRAVKTPPASGTVALHLTRTQDGGTVYCVPHTKAELSAVSSFFTGGAQYVVCLQDSDGDSQFDQYYRTANRAHALPIVSGNLGKPKPLSAPVPFKAQSGKLNEPYYIEIKYTGIPLLYRNRRNFSLYGRHADSDPESLTTTFSHTNIKTLPAKGFLSGATFEILETDGNRIKLRMLNDIPPSPFTIFTTVTYNVY